MKLENLYTVIWIKAIAKNIATSWTLWMGYLYLAAGALFDYMPAFRHTLGPHYNKVFLATGILMIIFRFKTRKPIIMKKETAVVNALVKAQEKKDADDSAGA